uniref:Metalloendopeptidase n=1 Tax=Strongyloides venezuelensis TaxID=75913 RepID=A0A0K0FCB2_STRVS
MLRFVLFYFLASFSLPRYDCRKPVFKKQPPPYTKISNVINYYHPNYLDNQIFVRTFDIIKANTCLDFQKANKSLKTIGINFYKAKRKNTIKLSASTKKSTKVFLKSKIYKNDRVLKYYIGLALGLIPELKRKDRDNDVKIFFGNILPPFKQYYKTNAYYHRIFKNTDFDFSSMMLYDSSYGKKYRGKPTYKSKFYPYYERSLKLFQDFSFNDLKRLNYLYCYSNFTKADECKNGGYFGRDRTVCECVYPFKGNNCETLVPNYPLCVKETILNATSTKKNKTITNKNKLCYFFIKAKPEKKIKMTILKFKTSNSNNCFGFPKLEIKYRRDKGARGLCLCENTKNIVLPALSNEIIMTFESFNSDDKLTFSYQQVE